MPVPVAMNLEKVLTSVMILTSYMMISDSIMHSVNMMHIKSAGSFIDRTVACAATVLCTVQICNTLLKVFIIINDKNKDDTVVVICTDGAEKGPKQKNEEDKIKHEAQQETSTEPTPKSEGKPECE